MSDNMTAMAEHLTSLGVSYQVDDDGDIGAGFTGEAGPFVVQFIDREFAVSVAAHPMISVPASGRRAAIELANHVNSRLVWGAWWVGRSSLTFELAIPTMSSPPSKDVVELALTAIPVSRHLPAFLKSMWTGCSPEEALAAIDDPGADDQDTDDDDSDTTDGVEMIF